MDEAMTLLQKLEGRAFLVALALTIIAFLGAGLAWGEWMPWWMAGLVLVVLFGAVRAAMMERQRDLATVRVAGGKR